VSWKVICLFVDLSQFTALFNFSVLFGCFMIGSSWLVGQLVNVLLVRLSNSGFMCCSIVRQSVDTLLFDSLCGWSVGLFWLINR
jgi:hypothetical protein